MAKQQKLILEYNGGASLFFINENPKYFDVCNPDGVLIDIDQLVHVDIHHVQVLMILNLI